MKNIGVFFGSRNTEHDISIITAQLIISTLKGMEEYRVIPIYLGKKGEWMIDDALGSLKTFTNPDAKIETRFQSYFLDLEQSRGKLVLRKKGFGGQETTIDLAFPAMHGAYGEDGTLQGLFEMFDVPYVGCDVTASALAMDKALTKQICEAHDIPTTKYIYFNKRDWTEKKSEITNQIKDMAWPVFVKPTHGGSSIGISKIKNQNLQELADKIDVAFFYDNKVIVEEGVENLMDVTCCVIGNGDLTASLLQESVFNAELFDFNEKYLNDGGSQLGKSENGLVIPARLGEETTQKIQKMAEDVYRALGCSGIARVDFLYDKITQEIFANEVNPLPGTLYHHLWKESGLEIDELIQKLINWAEERHEQKKEFGSTFESSILSSLNSAKLNSKKIKP